MTLTIQDYRRFLPANTITDAARFQAFENLVLLKYLHRYLGQSLTVDLLGTDPDPDLFEAVKPAWINLTYLESIPFFNLILTSSGYGVVSNQNIAPASMERIRDLKEACLAAANEGISQLLAFLEKTSPAGWNQCSLIPGSLVPDTETFNALTGLNVSRMLFVEITAHIRSFESLRCAAAFSPEFVAEMAQGPDHPVKHLVQSGLAYGAYHRFIDAPVFNRQGNPVPRETKWMELSKEYFQRALALLCANLDQYPVFRDHGYEAPFDNASGERGSFFVGGLTA